MKKADLSHLGEKGFSRQVGRTNVNLNTNSVSVPDLVITIADVHRGK